MLAVKAIVVIGVGLATLLVLAGLFGAVIFNRECSRAGGHTTAAGKVCVSADGRVIEP